MFDITLGYNFMLWLFFAYPLFVRFVVLPISFRLKLDDLCVLYLYEKLSELKNFGLFFTRKKDRSIIIFIQCIVLVVFYIYKKRKLKYFLLPVDELIKSEFNRYDYFFDCTVLHRYDQEF